MESKKIRLTASQQPVFTEPGENFECISDVMRQVNGKTDWLLTPEGSLSGYTEPPVLNVVGGPRVDMVVQSLAKIEMMQKEMGFGLALGTGWTEMDGFPYNQIRFYNKNGLIQTYSKRLLTQGWEGGGELHKYLPGHTAKLFPMDDAGSIVGSGLICNDFWASPRVSPNGNPYYQVQLAKLCVDVIFVAVNCNVEEHDPLMYVWHENHLQMMAREFGFWIVVANACTTMAGEPSNEKVQCPSGIIGPDGEWIAKCKDVGMDIVTAEVTITPRIATAKADSSIVKREGI